jgi:hypothetical protein
MKEKYLIRIAYGCFIASMALCVIGIYLTVKIGSTHKNCLIIKEK